VDAVPIVRLERDLARELGSVQLASRFDAWRELEPALMPFAGPEGLLRFLRRRGAGADKDAALLALLRRARHEPLAGRVVLMALLPGLKSIAGRVLIDVREREELWSALLACAWERIRLYPVARRRRRVAANLLLDCMRGTLAALARERTNRARASADLPADLACAEPEGGDVDALLARAVRDGAIAAAEAELVLSTPDRQGPAGRGRRGAGRRLQHPQAAPPAGRTAPAAVPRIPACTAGAAEPTFLSCSGRRCWAAGPAGGDDQPNREKEVNSGPSPGRRAPSEWERGSRSAWPSAWG
jgi:hypothetical protein